MENCLIPGEEHIRKRVACEDILYIREEPELCFYGLADGQSGKTRGTEGGRACLQRIADFIIRHGIGYLEDYPFPDELSFLLMKEIRAELGRLAEQQGEFSDYSSTLVCIAAEPETGRCMYIHLGDGCIIGVRQDRSLSMVSAPENGMTQYHTWLTTSSRAAEHLRVRFGSMKQMRRLVMLTDGAEQVCRGKNILKQSRDLLTRGSRQELIKFLESAGHRDDVGCVVLDLL